MVNERSASVQRKLAAAKKPAPRPAPAPAPRPAPRPMPKSPAPAPKPAPRKTADAYARGTAKTSKNVRQTADAMARRAPASPRPAPGALTAKRGSLAGSPRRTADSMERAISRKPAPSIRPKSGYSAEDRRFSQQKNNIARKGSPEERRYAPTTYKIKKGDNLTNIAKKYGTTVSKLAKDNKIKDPNMIYAGDSLTINKPPTARGKVAPPKGTPTLSKMSSSSARNLKSHSSQTRTTKRPKSNV